MCDWYALLRWAGLEALFEIFRPTFRAERQSPTGERPAVPEEKIEKEEGLCTQACYHSPIDISPFV